MRILQYRAKSGVVAAHAGQLRELTRERGALFIINDDWRAALACGADGAHLGPEDVTSGELAAIRQVMPGRLIGCSCGTEEEVRAAQAAGADYAGVGSVFPTQSKRDAGDAIGLEGLRRVAAATALPVAAVGGITRENLASVRATGAAMAAAISALALAADARAEAAEFVRIWNEAR